jgi:hypothetical protein
VWQELCGFNSSDGVLYQATEFSALLIVNSGSQVLNFNQALADEYNLGDFGNTRHP